MNESEYDFLSKFGSVRKWLSLSLDNAQAQFNQPSDAGVVNTTSHLEALAYFEALMVLPVARRNPHTGVRSILKDMMWDFNPNYPDAARNVMGAKLRMDWSKYPDVSPVVLLEMKVAFYLYYLAPANIYGAKGNSKKQKKANTVISSFQHGMRFLNEMSVRDQQEFGKDYALCSGQGIKDFDKMSYQDAAKTYKYSYSVDLIVFFKIIRSPYLAENLFGGYLPYIDLDSLEWEYRPDPKKSAEGGSDRAPATSDVLPNSVFERSSYSASMLVVDFLAAMGEFIVDIDTLKRRNARQFKRADSHGLNQRLMKMYIFMRLKAKGYSHEYMASVLGEMPEEFLTQRRSKDGGTTISKQLLVRLSNGRLNNELRIYLNQVNYSCCYLVAQYTGMRPSELAKIILDDALEQDGDYWLIKSQVVKHKSTYRNLFDDTWVAIPIIRDAITAAKICARYKQSPYLFSSVDTLTPDELPTSLKSNGIRYQLETFFEHVLPDDEYKALVFTPYMLRHTLAYQLYRADVGLPFISHQLKHFGDIVGGYQNRGYSAVTLGYGHIGDIIEMGGRGKGQDNQHRYMAEKEVVRLHYDPEGSYAGVNSIAHKARNQEFFKLCQDAGYSNEEVFEALVAKGIAVVNVGMGMCYGGRAEEFDDSLPCIGGLRCNPNRCPNSVITKGHAPKWREIYIQNRMLLADPFYQDRLDQIHEVIKEAKGVLEYLGEELEFEI